jgi:hypothetical protein
MVLFVNGSLGVGKTSVAQYLLGSFPQTVLLEGDALCNINPFDAYDTTRIAAVTDILRFMVERYQRIGFTRFVVDTIFEKTSEIEAVNGLLAEVDPNISHYLLVSSAGQREDNIRKRRRENHLWEIERSHALQELLITEFRASTLVRTIDVTGMSVSEVGETLLRDTGKNGRNQNEPAGPAGS